MVGKGVRIQKREKLLIGSIVLKFRTMFSDRISPSLPPPLYAGSGAHPRRTPRTSRPSVASAAQRLNRWNASTAAAAVVAKHLKCLYGGP